MTMLPPSRQSAFETAPMIDLIDILLRQFRRPLANFNVELTAEQIQTLAAEIANQRPLSDKAIETRDGLISVVQESERVLEGWGLTFQQALQTEMGDMPNWETTEEFLALANEKSNAELRIAGGSALVLLLGDNQFTPYLHFLIDNPALDDVSAIMAKRVLAFVA